MHDTNRLSIKQVAGQRLMAGFDGTSLNSGIRFLIDTLKVGGVILFAQNIVEPEQLRGLCTSIQEYAASCGLPPLFIAIDQEGGKVARLKAPAFKEFPGNPAIHTETDAVKFAAEMSDLLTGLKINMNMAPVLDVAPKGINSIMAQRAFGHDPGHVAEMGSLTIRQMQNRKIMSVAKHFPGIGRTTTDSHMDMPDIDLTVDDLESFDLIPFYAAIDAWVSGIMLSHIRYTKIDPKWPASLSPRIVTALLRNRMGFDGVVMTDDLDMGAIKNRYDIPTVIRQLLDADVDIALICHKGPDIETAYEEMLKGIADNRMLQNRARRSVERILALKEEYIRTREENQNL